MIQNTKASHYCTLTINGNRNSAKQGFLKKATWNGLENGLNASVAMVMTGSIRIDGDWGLDMCEEVMWPSGGLDWFFGLVSALQGHSRNWIMM